MQGQSAVQQYDFNQQAMYNKTMVWRGQTKHEQTKIGIPSVRI